MKIFIFLMSVLLLAGCASSTPQTDSLLSAAASYPSSHLIENVPFISQEDNQCGPATLTMALQWAGKSVQVKDVLPEVYTPEMKGSLQTDLITASRRQGMMAIPIHGLDDLLTEVSAGHPVIVFENLTFNWLPTWHYALVFGYDLPSKTVVMHSGKEAFKRWDMKKFERSWKLGDYWGLVVLPPGELSATAGELAHAKAAVALEQLGKWKEARIIYEKMLEQWPFSLPARIGVANIAFNQKDYRRAIYHLRQATEAHPQSSIAWHNLTIALGANHQIVLARKSALKAVKLASKTEKKVYSENLKEWIDKPVVN